MNRFKTLFEGEGGKARRQAVKKRKRKISMKNSKLAYIVATEANLMESDVNANDLNIPGFELSMSLTESGHGGMLAWTRTNLCMAVEVWQGKDVGEQVFLLAQRKWVL